MYKFYGWETANIKDSQGLNPKDYYDILSDIWSSETCAPRMRSDWTSDNKTLGQCSITAFLLQDIFGGKVYGIPLSGGNYHCFNDVDGCVFDLTSEQFGDEVLDYENCSEQNRSVHFSKEEKRLRYELLKRRLDEAMSIHPISPDHIKQYGEIYAAAFSGEPWNDPWEKKDAEIHISELMESKQSYGLEYVSDGKVVAFLLGTSMLFHYGRTFEINDLAVDPEYQGKGIAKTLMERCKSDMKKKGIVGIHLITANEGFLQGFYERHGFQKEERVILMGMEL